MKISSTTRMALLGLVLSSVAKADMQTCDANPECAALGLADHCCPTNLAGIFLDCCEQPGSSCAANAGCSGLQNGCCPTEDGSYLYCCFEPDPDAAKYRYEYTYWASTLGSNVGGYLGSTGSFSVNAATYKYERGSSLYDLIYLSGGVPDAGQYITGEKVLSLSISSTTAPECTQIMLQFDSLPNATADNYPTGRHSRYLGTLAPGQHRIQFTFLDRPDEDVLDEDVNAIAIFFDPGSTTTDTYTFYDLDSYVSCDGGNGCMAGSTKSCPALYLEVAGDTERKLQQEFTPDCSDCRNPACMGVGDCDVGPSYNDLAPDPNFQELTAAPLTEEEDGATDLTDEEGDTATANPSSGEESSVTDAETNEPDEGTPIFPDDLLSSDGAISAIKLSLVLVNLATFFALWL